VQHNRITEALTLINGVEGILEDSLELATDYQTKVSLLSDLNNVNEEILDAAIIAKSNYDEIAMYHKYLSTAIKTNVESVLNSINQTHILRAELHMYITELESLIDLFKDDISNADPLDIIEALDVKNAIDTDLFNDLDQADKTSFTLRMNNANL